MAIKQEIWDKAKALFEQGLSLNEISLETNINRTSISKKAKNENWIKSKNQQLKNDIKAIDIEKSTLDAKINTTVEKLAKLSDFEITILDQQIQDETGNKSLIFSTTNLAIIRANQILTSNKKTILVKEQYYEDGKLIKTEMAEKEVPLTISDIKESVELADKASLTLGVNQRHANSNINLQNNNQIVSEIKISDA